MAYRLYSNREITRIQQAYSRVYGADTAEVCAAVNGANAEMKKATSEQQIIDIANNWIGKL